MIQFLWVQILGTVSLGSIAQDLTRAGINVSSVAAAISRLTYRRICFQAQSYDSCMAVGRIHFLKGFLSGFDQRPLSVPCLWAFPCGLMSWNWLHQCSKQGDPESKCKQDGSHSLLQTSLSTDISTHFKKLNYSFIQSSPVFPPLFLFQDVTSRRSHCIQLSCLLDL